MAQGCGQVSQILPCREKFHTWEYGLSCFRPVIYNFNKVWLYLEYFFKKKTDFGMLFIFSSSMAKGGASESAFSWVSQGKNEF